MTRRNKILIWIAASIPALLIVLFIAAIIVSRSVWFQDFAKAQIISAIEDSVGGTAEIGSFRLDLFDLNVEIRNFVLHGTEPKGDAPLASAALIKVQAGLSFSGLYHLIAVRYGEINQPKIDVIVFPDGKTNIPEPKVKSQSTNNSGLQTVVDLRIGRFQINNGLLQFSQQSMPFNAHGENLRALINYNTAHPGYVGNLQMDPLILNYEKNPPLNVAVNLPLVIDANSIQLNNASLKTGQSQVLFSVGMQNMNSPQIAASLNASISVAEMQKSLGLPINAGVKGAPSTLTAELAAHYDEKPEIVQVQTAKIVLGGTTLDAFGTLDPSKNSAVQFSANAALDQLSRLLNIPSVQASGALQANGSATLDTQKNYAVNGSLKSSELSIIDGTTRLSNVSLNSTFHADPNLLSLDGLKLNALGGTVTAKVLIENMERLTVDGTLHGFSLPVLANSFTGKRLGYDGTLNGSIQAHGDLKAKGTRGYSAAARLTISPGPRGVPVSGRLDADCAGSSGAVDLHQSYIAMPHSRLDLSGALNKQLDLNLVSHNLNDFLPAINFGSTTPESSLPVTLKSGGTATIQAQITGNLSAPHITSHIAVNRFAADQYSFNQFAADLNAASAGLTLQNGVLNGAGLQTNFNAALGLHDWKPQPRSPLTANLTMQSSNIGELTALAGESSMEASGKLNADVHINGTYGDPLGTANLQVVNGSAYGQPFDHLTANVNLADQLITLSSLELAAAGGRIDVSGSFHHPRDSFMVGHAQLQATTNNLQLANLQPLERASPGVAGVIQLKASGAADITQVNHQNEITISNVTADLSASGLRVQNQNAGNLTATARTVNGAVQYQLNSNFAGSAINVNGTTSLNKGYLTNANASIRDLSVSKTLQIVGEGSVPAQGNLSASAHLAGTLTAPTANLSFALTQANVYQEPITRLQGSVNYSDTLLSIPSISLDVPAGSVTLSGSFSHPASDFKAGSLQLKVDSTDIQLAKIEHVEEAKPGLTGVLHLAADVSARLQPGKATPDFRVSTLSANVAATNLRVHDRAFGELTFNATTAGSDLNFRLDSSVAKSEIHASGQTQLAGDYNTRANLTFGNIRYANLAPFIETESGVKPAFDAALDGQASINGPLMNADQLSARLQVSTLDMKTVPQASPTGAPPIAAVDLHNDGPIVVTLNHSVVDVQQFHIQGPGTNITAAGAINLKNGAAPLGLSVTANANLGVLQDVDREFYSSGTLSMNAMVRGNFSKPLVNGRLELKNANVNYLSFPNGISNANAVILLNGTSATIQTFTGESGGGRVTLTGFAAYTGTSLTFNVKAAARHVRVRYSGVSATSNAAINIIGTTQRSLIEGDVTVQRIVYGSSADTGTLLSFASAPPSTPSAPSPFLTGMHLAIHVRTAADLNVVTTYADRLNVFADLTVRGTAQEPGVLGKVVVTDGQLEFFGNTYTVNVGTVNFYNPNAIQPILNFSLQTIAQNVNVTLGVTGPINNLHLSYTSDPPLTFEQIVALLATNTTPSNPMIAAQQPTPPQQSVTQMGESALLGQAVANPLASRVQRVFGLSQLAVSPEVAGANGQPGARVTLQQKIANNLTFTYITDVTETNSEIIKVQFAITPTLSAVAMRDFNGNVSMEVFYRFKKR